MSRSGKYDETFSHVSFSSQYYRGDISSSGALAYPLASPVAVHHNASIGRAGGTRVRDGSPVPHFILEVGPPKHEGGFRSVHT